ncbi:hypothetical protein [Fluviispira sanaruensis]|uniref:Outer membrane protein beta-barrel domain-containing protein n=1 Tax=Fluviispira sanaruensis TaxID=2493639 RepID=A0A4P2VNZ9_FLUSA|nr:hypothetical protein [Fluviispira sanaruensis]BBH53399.1 hypothetical protein JCM31447_18420 [Fluviispira sanaruensis]
MKIGQLYSTIVSVVFFAFMKSAFACSSCGSSATSPLVLNPDENLKMYFGIAQNFNYMDYGVKKVSDTKQVPNNKISSRRILTLGIGYRTTENSFVTLTGSFVRNQGAANPANVNEGFEHKYLVADPILAGRYNLMDMSIASTYRPQIQLALSYKPSLAKNMVDDDPVAVRTVGNGFHQVTGGLDFWFGMPFVQFGFAQFVTYSFDRHPDNAGRTCCGMVSSTSTQMKRTRDFQYTTVLTVGHAFKESNISVQGGAILDYIGKEVVTNKNNTTGVETSWTRNSAQSNSLFANVKYKPTFEDTFRLSYTLGGAYNDNLGYFTNANQTTFDTLSLSYERTFF